LDLAGRQYGSSIFKSSLVAASYSISITLFYRFSDTHSFQYQKVITAGHTSPDKEFSFLGLKLYQRTFL